MRRTFAAAWIVLLTAAGGAQTGPTASLDLGMDAATPGEDATLVAVLSTTGAPDIRQIRFDVTFPAALVSFVKVSERSGALAAGATVKAHVVKGTTGPDPVVRVDVAASSRIPDGMLVALDVDVSNAATPGTAIAMKGGAAAARSAAGGDIPIRVVDGAISVVSDAEAAVAACFFYMH